MPYFIGVMSGTSLDGVDVVIVDFTGVASCELIAAKTFSFSIELYEQLQSAIYSPKFHLKELGHLDVTLGQFIGKMIQKVLDEQNISSSMISAIGSHGHTLFHSPNGLTPFSLQIGDPNVIAELTGITTIANFRQRDIAAGGQGAPLVPAFHADFFSDAEQPRAIINIGGIANITLLDKRHPILGFDTGPGNGLLDAWSLLHQGKPYDDNGNWAASGQCHNGLLAQMLMDPYFHEPIPKSTGREYFNLKWLEHQLKPFGENLLTADVQATLLELTAHTISLDILHYCSSVEAVYVCGGGVHNEHLLKSLQRLLKNKAVLSTERLGLHPNWVEATAFAWLAYRTLNRKTGNLPSVTGARRAVILGAIYLA
jgi:anhydro-N-acetylmuramic acid kinase